MSCLIKSVLATSLIFLASICDASNYQNNHSMRYGLTGPNLSPSIITLNITTNNIQWAFIEYDYFAGTSITSPCSDLSLIRADDGMTIINSYTDEISSQKIEKMFGSIKTCIRLDIKIAGVESVFTTGDIQLVWDNNFNSYTAAIPDSVTIALNAATTR